MNWDQIEGQWKQFTGSAREHSGISPGTTGERLPEERSVGWAETQERYGVAKAEAKSRPTRMVARLGGAVSATGSPPPGFRSRPPGREECGCD